MYIRIRVKTEQKVEKLSMVKNDLYDVSVKEKATQNRANRRIIELLGQQFKGRRIRIISGHHSPSKIIDIE
ncbi:MAG TPA: DUF167 family protein [Candidatus Paceibacterota bacterium]